MIDENRSTEMIVLFWNRVKSQLKFLPTQCLRVAREGADVSWCGEEEIWNPSLYLFDLRLFVFVFLPQSYPMNSRVFHLHP